MTRVAQRRERTRLVLGLMSGTSADGIDVALVRVGRQPLSRDNCPRVLKISPRSLSPPASAPKSCASPRAPLCRTGELSQLNFRLGMVFAEALLDACRKFRVSPKRISLIGSHGQTVYHQGKPSLFLGARVSSTLQIGEPAVIAARTGITTVGDFRPSDMAAGGQGAPLVPWVDYLLYRHPRRGRAALNIGGIANVTVIPAGARERDVFAFDTGPGNMLIDGLMRHFTRGKKSFDRDATMAERGRLLPSLLNHLLSEPYFRQPPPKTTGREQYGKAALARIIQQGQREGAQPEDLVRTATLLTALSIVDALHRWVLPKARIGDLIVSGGGARNPLIMAQLAAALPDIEIVTSDHLGVPSDAKEAFAFALLANETIHRRPSNLPSATGASSPAILGKICYPPLP